MLRFLEGTCRLRTHSCYQDISPDELCQNGFKKSHRGVSVSSRDEQYDTIYLLHESPKLMLLKTLNKNSGHWEKGSTDLQLTHCEPFQTTQQGGASQVETDGISELRR